MIQHGRLTDPDSIGSSMAPHSVTCVLTEHRPEGEELPDGRPLRLGGPPYRFSCGRANFRVDATLSGLYQSGAGGREPAIVRTVSGEQGGREPMGRSQHHAARGSRPLTSHPVAGETSRP